jgi:hypothetical protein
MATKSRPATTIGGKFQSTGKAEEQRENRALVIRLMGEIGADGKATVAKNDQLFLEDCMVKLNRYSGSSAGLAVFGWRQVEKMVALHAEVMAAREVANGKG